MCDRCVRCMSSECQVVSSLSSVSGSSVYPVCVNFVSIRSSVCHVCVNCVSVR